MIKVLKSILFSLLPNIFYRFYKKADFIWMIHPITIDDIYKRYKILRYYPSKILIYILKFLPVLILSSINGLRDDKDKDLNGYIFGCFIFPHQIRDNKLLVRNKIIKAAKLASKLNAYILCIGGLIVVDEDTEKNIRDKYGLTLANGAATAVVVMSLRINKIFEEDRKTFEDFSIAIINSTSVKGKLISKYWCQYNFKEKLLLGRNLENLDKLRKEINSKNINISNDLNSIKKYNLVIIAPSYNRLNFKADYFKDSTLIYDINDPLYDFSKIKLQFPNIKVYKNGLINTSGIKYNYDLGIPQDNSFVCLSESYLLAQIGPNNQSYFNGVTLNEVNKLKTLFDKSNFYLN